MKRAERNRRDREFSARVRSRGKCERCGKTANLQAAHIFSRRYLRLRWMDDNCVCLCAGCHFWAHHNPVLFSEWIRQKLGPDRFQHLLNERNNLDKVH
jgi:hypothetical protein